MRRFASFHLRDIVHRVGGAPILLLAVLAIVGGTWIFIELADEVREGATREIDQALLLAFRHPDDPARPIGPTWLPDVVRDITAVGGATVHVTVTLLVAGYLIIVRNRGALIFLLIAVGGGLALGVVLKEVFSRPRPDIVPHLTEVGTASFPSGHAMFSAVVYLTLAALLAQLAPRFAAKLYILIATLLLVGAIGLSRVYLGVHYPSDVLAGWSAGLVWAVLCWLTARYLRRHGAMERAPTEPASDSA